MFFGNNGCGAGNGCEWIIWVILIVLLLSCACGNNSDCGCNNNCSC